MIVLIPAYRPDAALTELLDALPLRPGVLDAVVVDDGSGPDFADVFAAARAHGAEVVSHPDNRGKGAALKTGLAHIRAVHPGRGVVCADADGQHLVADILRVAARVREGVLVLGSRHFEGPVPLRSRFGNTLTRVAFRLATGVRVTDTQTGLRGCSASLLTRLGEVEGQRYEYELNVLLRAATEGITIEEVPIRTVYVADNRSSHFNPLVDSARIYGQLLRFSASSLVSFGVDVVAVVAFEALTGNLLLSAVMARVISASFNFFTNRRLVFEQERSVSLTPAALRYSGVSAVVLAANYAVLRLLTAGLGLAVLPAKLITEAVLFPVSYWLQERVVFGQRTASRRGGVPLGSASPRLGGLVLAVLRGR